MLINSDGVETSYHFFYLSILVVPSKGMTGMKKLNSIMNVKFYLFVLFLCGFVNITTGKEVSHSVFTMRPEDHEAIYLLEGKRRIAKQDVSGELQDAINHVKSKYNFGIVFVPEGDYYISRTIYVPSAVRIIGYGKRRPCIILKRNSKGFDCADNTDKGKAKYMFWFTSDIKKDNVPPRDATAGTFYSGLSNIDLLIEDGNPFAVALRTHYAQHSFIEHVDIHIGKAKAGIFDVGNEIDDVRFYGGDYGIYTTRTSPSWQMMIMNSYFIGQRCAAVRTEEAGLTFFRSCFKNTPICVEVNPNRIERLYMENCSLENISKVGILSNYERLSTNQISLKNLYCQNVPRIVSFRDTGKEISEMQKTYQVQMFSSGLQVNDMVSLPNYGIISKIVPMDNIPDSLPDELPALPKMDKWVNIMELGAKGDGVTDDTEVFKKAIEQYETIYIPQGWYILSEQLKLKHKTSLIGMNPISTQLKLRENTSVFSGFGSPVPLLETPMTGQNIISGIGINTGAYNYRAVGIKWCAGENSYLNDVKFIGGHGSMTKGPFIERGKSKYTPTVSTPDNPVLLPGIDKAWDSQYWSLWVTDGGGGTFKNIWIASTYSSSGVYINNTQTKSRVFAMSVEHHVRNEVRLNNVKRWSFYALQLEEELRESKDCQPIEIQECDGVTFANLFLFRVIWLETPAPYCIRIWNSKNLEFNNVHNFSQMRFTTDLLCYDVNRKLDVRPWEASRIYISGIEAEKKQLKNDSVKQVATGFEYLEGMASDSKGNVYFCEQRMKRIYRWDASTGMVSLVADFPWQPLSLACDENDRLLVIVKYYPQPGSGLNGKKEQIPTLPDAAGTTFSHWGNTGFTPLVYSIDPLQPEASFSILPLKPTVDLKNIRRVILPTHRWRDLNDFDIVVSNLPEYSFVAEDERTIIPQYYDLVRSSSTFNAAVGNRFFCVDEYRHITKSALLSHDLKVSDIQIFSNLGEFGVNNDKSNNVFILDGYIYQYTSDGQWIRTIVCPERPTSVCVGGAASNLLFVAARKSLYVYQLH